MCFKRIGLLFFNIFLICLNDLDIFFFYKIEINFFFYFFIERNIKELFMVILCICVLVIFSYKLYYCLDNFVY